MNFNFRENKMESSSEISAVSIILFLISVAILVYGILTTILDTRTVMTMRKNEKMLKAKGLDKARIYNNEYIAYNEKTGKYETRLKKNAAWYQRLMEE